MSFTVFRRNFLLKFIFIHQMRPLTEEESKAVFTKLANYIVRSTLL